MADTPVEGLRAPKTAVGKAMSPDATIDGDHLVEEVRETRRPSLKSRITRPGFVITLQEGSPVGEFEISAQIGEGAMGTVYSAIHPLIGKRVAIKVLKPELCANQASIDRFVAEAQAVNKIGHPNIVDVFSLGELPDGRAYFVMEWLRGEDLKTRLGRGPMPVLEACDVLDGIARALDAAHAKDIVHRDLKPDNVFLHQVENGPVMVKLLDFGIAKLMRTNAQKKMDKTNTGDMLGTPRYISPEQARGVSVDHRADIYSLGVMAYEVLAGRAPFTGETAMDLVVAHMQEDPPPLSQFARVPRPLEQCVMRMLEKDPAKRPTLDDVRNVLIDPTKRNTPKPGELRMSAIHAQIRVGPPRWVWAVGAIGVVGIVAIVLAIVLTRPQQVPVQAPPPTNIDSPSPSPSPSPAPVHLDPPAHVETPAAHVETPPPPPAHVETPPPPPVHVETPKPPPVHVEAPKPPPVHVEAPKPKTNPQPVGDDDVMVPDSVKKRSK